MSDASTEGISLWRISVFRLKRNKLAMFGLCVLVLLIITSTLAPVLTPYQRDKTDLLNTYGKPSAEHKLGTDEIGRDVLTRLLYGGRISLVVGFVSTSISLCIGVILGATAGYIGGAVDSAVMRLVDIFMSFPFFVIAITAAAIFGPGIWNTMLITGLLYWPRICRIVRGEVLSLKQREFIEAARAIGLNAIEIVMKHVLPNVLGSVIVYATLGIASGILSEAGLSYLVLGVKQPQPSWGNMLAAAQSLRTLRLHWWLWMPPGLLVFLTILSINFFGDGLRDALDPKLKR